MTRIEVTLTCGHVKDYTGKSPRLPEVGSYHPCFSSCDYIPTNQPKPRYVKAIEVRDDDAMET